MIGKVVQLSVAEAAPVFAGKLEASQLIVMLAGQVITGAVTSWMVIVCVQLLALPQPSVAVHVLVIIELPPQLPGVVTSEELIMIAPVQLSVAVAVPVLVGKEEASQLIVMLAGQVITGGTRSVIVIT